MVLLLFNPNWLLCSPKCICDGRAVEGAEVAVEFAVPGLLGALPDVYRLFRNVPCRAGAAATGE